MDILEQAADGHEALTVEQQAQLAVLKAPAADKQSERPRKLEIDQSKPASIAALVEFAKFMLPRIIRKSDEVVLALTVCEDVKEFNRLANRVQKVIGNVPCMKN
jgi:hypothetical protein